jgi:hypothetical protein
LLKRNLARADEISSDERKMRQELERELDRLRTDFAKLGDHRLVDHRVASEDLVVMREQLQALQQERDHALFKATQYEVRYANHNGSTPLPSERSGLSVGGRQKDEEMILLLAENAQRDEELIGRSVWLDLSPFLLPSSASNLDFMTFHERVRWRLGVRDIKRDECKGEARRICGPLCACHFDLQLDSYV